MNSEPTADDFALLLRYFEEAMAGREAISWSDGFPDYPVYPEAVEALMDYISSSPWCNHEYEPGETKEILDHIDSADMTQVRSALTAIARHERFCDGSWQGSLEDGILSPVIERARQLTRG